MGVRAADRFGVNSVIGVIESGTPRRWTRWSPRCAGRRSDGAGCSSRSATATWRRWGSTARVLPLVRLITTEADVGGAGAAAARRRSTRRWRSWPGAARWPRRGGSWTRAVRSRGRTRARSIPRMSRAALLRSPDRAVFVADKDELDRVLDAPRLVRVPAPAAAPAGPYPALRPAGAGHRRRGDRQDARGAAPGGPPGRTARRRAGDLLPGAEQQLAARLDVLIGDELRKRVEVATWTGWRTAS